MKYIEVIEYDEYHEIDEEGNWEINPYGENEVQRHKFNSLLEFKQFVEKMFVFSVKDMDTCNGNDLQISYDEGKVGITKTFWFYEIEKKEVDLLFIDWDKLK